MKIIITGASGFIGKNLIPVLLNDKKITNILLLARTVDKSDIKHLSDPRITVCKVDLVQETIPPLSRYDALIHLADNIPGQHDILNFADNSKIAENIVINILLKNVVKRVIYTSTLDVYGKPVYLPIDENHPTTPLTFYGISKLSNEHFISTGARNAQIDCLILRLSQVYGYSEQLVKAIPLFVNKIKNNEEIRLQNNGNIVRDWVYVKDVISIIHKSIYKNASGTFNIAYGEGNSLRDLITILEETLSKKAIIKNTPALSDLRPKIVLSIKKAKKNLHYHPKFDLKNGINDYIN